MQKKTIKTVICDLDAFGSTTNDNEYPPSDAIGYIKWFQEKLDRVPEEYKSITKIEVQTYFEYYDEIGLSIFIYYDRKETDQEAEDRLLESKTRALKLKKQIVKVKPSLSK